jgi:hypothetical protein
MITDKEVEDRVESWNWNLGIFEIYDEVRDEPDHVTRSYLLMLTTFSRKMP